MKTSANAKHSIRLLSIAICASLFVAGNKSPSSRENALSKHQFLDFVQQWNGRSNQATHHCFFSPMNCQSRRASKYVAMVKQDEWDTFLRALNVHRTALEEQKMKKKKQRNSGIVRQNM